MKIHDLVLPEARAENEGVVPTNALVVMAVEDVVSKATDWRIVAGATDEDVSKIEGRLRGGSKYKLQRYIMSTILTAVSSCRQSRFWRFRWLFGL